MKLKPTVNVKLLSMEALLACHQPLQVLEFCKNCSNYNTNYSCPNFSFDRLKWLKQYGHVALILTAVPTEQLAEKRNQLAAKNFTSATLLKYSANIEACDLYARVSMYSFDQIKDKINVRLLALEKRYDNTVGIPPGSCTYCKVCGKADGEPCRYPEKLRYSLEALGFLVSQVLDVFFDYRIDWQNRDFGENFVTISAIFSKSQIEQASIVKALDGMCLELPI